MNTHGSTRHITDCHTAAMLNLCSECGAEYDYVEGQRLGKNRNDQNVSTSHLRCPACHRARLLYLDNLSYDELVRHCDTILQKYLPMPTDAEPTDE